MIDCEGPMEDKYFNELMTSLEDAVAFVQGDTSRAKVVEVEVNDPVPEERKRYPSLVERFSGYTGDHTPEEWDTSAAVGKEV